MTLGAIHKLYKALMDEPGAEEMSAQGEHVRSQYLGHK